MGLRFYVTSLLLLALVASPAIGRTYVRCADGSPCGSRTALEAERPCCPPTPCVAHHVPADKRCVLEVVPAPVRMMPDWAQPAALDLPVAILPREIVIIPAAGAITHALLDVSRDHPPDQPAPKQGRAPRAPPTAVA